MNDTPNGTAVIPMLVCQDAAAEIEFCKAAFGAAELSRRTAQDGTVVHATLAIGPSLVMVHGQFPHLASRAPDLDGSSPVVIYLYVQDADSMIERSRLAGARVLIPPAGQTWGDRVGRILDPAGHVWNVASRVKPAKSSSGTTWPREIVEVRDHPGAGRKGLHSAKQGLPHEFSIRQR